MLKTIKLLPVIITLLLPSVLLGGTHNHKPDKQINACPDNLQSLLMGINNSLSHKKWINFDLDACPHIQTEIIKNVDKIIESKDFEKYYALMNKKTMRIIRNAFFARKGYKFNDPELQEHFSNYAWYKPMEKAEVVLTDEDNQHINLLKTIEDKWNVKGNTDDWDGPPVPVLPQGVKIVQKDGKALLRFKEKTLDVTPIIHEGNISKRDFTTIRANSSQDAVLVCSQHRHVDSQYLDRMDLYSANGKLIYSFNNSEMNNRIVGLKNCPELSSPIPNLLFSYNNNGMSGATWDTLVTFDAKLKSITVLDCMEPACFGTSLFSDVNGKDIYISVAAEGSHKSSNSAWYSKNAERFILYDETISRAASNIGSRYISTWSLWLIDNTGNLSLSAEASATFHDQSITQGSFSEIIDVPYPTVDLMAYSDRDSRPPQGKILTSVKFGKNLILYRYDDRHYSTSMIPLE